MKKVWGNLGHKWVQFISPISLLPANFQSSSLIGYVSSLDVAIAIAKRSVLLRFYFWSIFSGILTWNSLLDLSCGCMLSLTHWRASPLSFLATQSMFFLLLPASVLCIYLLIDLLCLCVPWKFTEMDERGFSMRCEHPGQPSPPGFAQEMYSKLMNVEFKGPVQLKNPAHEFVLISEPVADQPRYYFCKQVQYSLCLSISHALYLLPVAHSELTYCLSLIIPLSMCSCVSDLWQLSRSCHQVFAQETTLHRYRIAFSFLYLCTFHSSLFLYT